jgi:hypothetical protein
MLILPMHFRPLSRNPFANILWAIPELGSVVLGERKKLHSITVDNRHVLEINSECARFLSQHIPEGFHMFPGKLPTYEQHDKTTSADSVDSETHRLRPHPVAATLLVPVANDLDESKPDTNRKLMKIWQKRGETLQQSNESRKFRKFRKIADLEGISAGVLAEFELLRIDF